MESELARSLSRIFPSARILKSVKWTDATSGIEYETDAIVWLDDLLLVFEAKANIINPAGRRGSHAYFDSFDYAVVKATWQTQRLKENIYRSSNPFELRPGGDDKQPLTIIASDISHVVCFGVTLERFASASYGADTGVWDRVKRSGLKPMPILAIGDLLLVEELLKAEYERVHYFLRRTEIPFEFDFVADELDLVALYIKSGFVVSKQWRDKKSLLYLYGLSDFLRFYTKLSPYYDKNIPAPRRLTSEWEAEVERIWTKRSQKRIRICYDLLNAPLLHQQRFILDVRRCGEEMRRKRKRDQMDGVLIELLDQYNPCVIVCLVHDARSKLEFPESIIKLADNVRKTYSFARVIVFRFVSESEKVIPCLLRISPQIGGSLVSIGKVTNLAWAAVELSKRAHANKVSDGYNWETEPIRNPV